MGASAVDPPVTAWRPAGVDGLLCLAGTTSSYAVAPRGELVLGAVVGGAMAARRERERYVAGPGDVCVWDASAPHAGRPHGGPAWAARLVVVEAPAARQLLAGDDDAPAPAATARRVRDPILRAPRLAARFVALHDALRAPASALAAEAELMAWLDDALGGRPASSASARAARRHPGVRRAIELLADDPARNVTLDELAAVAGLPRRRLTELFGLACGMAPHRFQIAQRVRLARRLLEAGAAPDEAAAHVGFADQSHLHRHFRATLGITPGQYRRLVRPNVQDTAPAPI